MPALPSPEGPPAFAPPTVPDADVRVPAIPPPTLPGIGGPATLPVTVRPEDARSTSAPLATDPTIVPIAPPDLTDPAPVLPASDVADEPRATDVPTIPTPIVPPPPPMLNGSNPVDASDAPVVPPAPAVPVVPPAPQVAAVPAVPEPPAAEVPVAALLPDAPVVPTLPVVPPASVAPLVPTLPVVPPPPAQIVALEPFESMEPAPETTNGLSVPTPVDVVADIEADPDTAPDIDTAPNTGADSVSDTVFESILSIEFEPVTAPADAPASPEPAADVDPAAPAAQLAMPPSLPSITAAAASPVLTEDTSWQDDVTTWTPDQLQSAKPAKKHSTSSPLRSLAVTLAMAVFAAAVGAGAHLGYDWYQQRDGAATASSVPDDLASWSQIDPPAIRFTDTTSTIVTDLGLREITAHRDLVSGARLLSVSETTFAGETNTFEVELRDGRALVRPDPDTPWSPTTVEEATWIIGDEGLTDVFTVSDLFPDEILPFAIVLESAEVQLPLGAIRQLPTGPAAPADAAVSAEDGAAPAVRPAASDAPVGLEPTTVWNYRVTIDLEAFRAAEGAAFAAWERQLGRAAGSQLDVWVDANGIVRQLVIDAEGTTLTQTLVGAAPTSAKFEAEPLAGAAPVGDVPADGTPSAGADGS